MVVPFKNRRGIEGKDDGQETVPISVSCYPGRVRRPFHPSFFSLASSPLDSFFPSFYISLLILASRGEEIDLGMNRIF